MKKRIIIYILLGIAAIAYTGCKDDAKEQATEVVQPKPVSESDTITIPRYKPEPLSQKALQSITEWIAFNELHQSILTIGKSDYTKRIKIERTNFLYFSEELDNNRWQSKECTALADTTIAPNGTKTAEGFKSTDVSSFHYLHQPYFMNEEGTVTFSANLKKGATNLVYLGVELTDPTEKETVVFNVADGKIAYIPEGITAQIIKKENGWFLCSAQFKSSQRSQAIIGATQTPTQLQYEGDDSAIDFYVWGAQLENKKQMGSYLPTGNTLNSVQEQINYIPSENEKQIINSSYQKLYFQVDDIYRRITEVESGTIPEKYKIPYITSRLVKLKTYTLLLADALKNNSYLTNKEINTKLDTIYTTYNSILAQINAINDTTLEEHMEQILKRQQQ